jgi:hypothetical protein
MKRRNRTGEVLTGRQMTGRGPLGVAGAPTLRAFLRELSDHLVAVLDAPIAYPPRGQREHPPAAAR